MVPFLLAGVRAESGLWGPKSLQTWEFQRLPQRYAQSLSALTARKPDASSPHLVISSVLSHAYKRLYYMMQDDHTHNTVQIVREKLFKRLYKEIPYKTDIVSVAIDPHRDGSIRIEKHILVPDRHVRYQLCSTDISSRRLFLHLSTQS